MALYAFDGTGNEDRAGTDRDSNVLFFFEGYDDPLKNRDPEQERGSLYLQGIGTLAGTKIGSVAAKAFGIGARKRLGFAMDRLKNNIRHGDAVVDIVGFSRGAALAVAFANKIQQELPSQKVRFAGVFDIVAEFGLPGRRLNAGIDMDFTDNIEQCFHAMAMDEQRAVFQLTRLNKNDGSHAGRLHELWFRGVHSDVGGGNNNPTLNPIALHWMFMRARSLSLPVTDMAISDNQARLEGPMRIKDQIDIGKKRRIFDTDVLHASVGLDGVEHDEADKINNPKVELARMDDNGTFTPSTGRQILARAASGGKI